MNYISKRIKKTFKILSINLNEISIQINDSSFTEPTNKVKENNSSRIFVESVIIIKVSTQKKKKYEK